MRKKNMSKKIRRPRLLLAAIIFMIVSAIILAQTIRSFTAENRSKAYSNLSASKCIQEGGTIPVIQDPPICCVGLVLWTDPLKTGQRGYVGTCIKSTTGGCVGEGGTIPLVQNPPTCCDGLVLSQPKTNLKGITGTCAKKAATKCITKGGYVPTSENPPTCCNGLVLAPTPTGRKGVLGQCAPPLACNKTCTADSQCKTGYCYQPKATASGYTPPKICRHPSNPTSRTCTLAPPSASPKS